MCARRTAACRPMTTIACPESSGLCQMGAVIVTALMRLPGIRDQGAMITPEGSVTASSAPLLIAVAGSASLIRQGARAAGDLRQDRRPESRSQFFRFMASMQRAMWLFAVSRGDDMFRRSLRGCHHAWLASRPVRRIIGRVNFKRSVTRSLDAARLRQTLCQTAEERRGGDLRSRHQAKHALRSKTVGGTGDYRRGRRRLAVIPAVAPANSRRL
jgi:hypothetical protein